MTDSNGYLRMPTPQHQAYDTSAGERQILANITPENAGLMIAPLFNQQSISESNRREYSGLIEALAGQQSVLANRKLANDRQENDGRFAIAGMQHGNMPLSLAMHIAQPTAVPNWMGQGELRGLGLEGDRLAKLATEAQALERAGTGAQRAVEAGFEYVPGQQVQGAQGILGARSVTGTPLDLRVEGLRQAGENSRNATTNKDGTTFAFNPLTGEANIGAKASDPNTGAALLDRAVRQWQSLSTTREQEAKARPATTAPQGGNFRPEGANTGSAGTRPQPVAQRAPATPPPPGNRIPRPIQEAAQRLVPEIGAIRGTSWTPDGYKIVGATGTRVIPHGAQ